MSARPPSPRTLGTIDDIALHHLLKFLAVVETRSQAAAAAELGCTRPNISHAIKSLQSNLGFDILHDSKPTKDARRILPTLRQIVALASKVERLSNPNKIHVAVTRTLSGAMGGLFHGLETRFKDTEIEFSSSTSTSDQILRQVAEGDIDVGIVIEEAIRNYPTAGLHDEPTNFAHPCSIFCSKGHELAKKASVSRFDFIDVNFAWFDPRLSPELDDELEKNLSEGLEEEVLKGKSLFNIGQVVSDLEGLYSTLMCGKAVTIMPDAFALYGLREIVKLKTEEGWKLPEWKFAIVRHKSNTTGPVNEVYKWTSGFCVKHHRLPC